jgi:ribosomal protein L32E
MILNQRSLQFGGAAQVRKIGYFKPVRFLKPDGFESQQHFI